MAETTGPVLAIGAITVTNRVIFNEKDMDWRPVVATTLAALGFAAAERMWAPGARMLAWTALVAVCFTRLEADVPSPVESALLWWEAEPKMGRRSGKQPGRRRPATREA